MSSAKNNQSTDEASAVGGPPASSAYPPPYWYPGTLPPDDEISLSELWRVVADSKWLIAGITFACAVTAITYALLATPLYRADTLLAPVEQDRQGGLASIAQRFGGLADLAGVSLPGGGDTSTALATLKSRDFIGRFIREEKLKPLLFPDDWNPETESWRPKAESLNQQIKGFVGLQAPQRRDPMLAPGEPTLWDTYKVFREEVLAASSDSKTGLVTVSVEWTDPEVAARWANLLVDRLNADQRKRAIQRAESSIAYLRQQIEQTSLADLRVILFRLIEEHTKTITLARASDEYVFEVIDPAIAPQEKSKPRRSLIAAFGLAGGLALGLLAAFLRAGLRKSGPDAP